MNCYNMPMISCIIIIIPFCRGGNLAQRNSHLPKVTQVLGSGAGFDPNHCVLVSSTLLPRPKDLECCQSKCF